MNQVRVYKVKIRENVLRSMFFTDRNIAIGVMITLDFILYMLMRGFDKHFYVFTTLSLDIFVIFIMNLRVDRQPLFIVIKRFIFYAIRNRNERF